MKNRPYRVMIDPGHGGKDPGAVSKIHNIKEKDVNLSVAKYLELEALRGDYLFETHTTRTGDSYRSLPNRCWQSEYWHVNAFLSIHCNARPLRGKEGIEIEVYHAVGSIPGSEFANITLGLLLSEVEKKTKVISRGVKERGFYVLKHTSMPAILVELGFLSDPEEAVILADKKNQRIMAKAMVEATELFLEGGGI